METAIALGPLEAFPPGRMTAVEAEGRSILIVRDDEGLRAFDARCPHYGAPLADGVLADGSIVCPWHHACFDATTGRPLEPPALTGLRRYPVRVHDGAVFLEPEPNAPAEAPAREDARTFVICGGGAAGATAAITLRREGFTGRLVLVSADPAPPYDRTLLSKERLQGAELPAPLPLRPANWWRAQDIELRLGRSVTAVDAADRRLTLDDSTTLAYDAALLATGARPRTLPVPGAGLAGVHTLRSREDLERFEDTALAAGHVAIVGGSFIACECAWSLRERGVAVSLVAPEALPFAGLFGERVARRLVQVHEALGTTLYLGRKVEALAGDGQLAGLRLDDGTFVPAACALVGIGVAPVAGFDHDLADDDEGGLRVDEKLACGPGLYAAGDLARFPLARTGEAVRIEHWRLACQHGEHAARNMLGADAPFERVPFFWSAQQIALYYVGHATGFDAVVHHGDPEAGEPFIAYYGREGRVLAALGVERNAELAALELALRHDALPSMDELERDQD